MLRYAVLSVVTRRYARTRRKNRFWLSRSGSKSPLLTGRLLLSWWMSAKKPPERTPPVIGTAHVSRSWVRCTSNAGATNSTSTYSPTKSARLRLMRPIRSRGSCPFEARSVRTSRKRGTGKSSPTRCSRRSARRKSRTASSTSGCASSASARSVRRGYSRA